MLKSGYVRLSAAVLMVLVVAGCFPRGPREEGRGRVVPGITVLLRDSLHLIEGRRVGLMTNQTGLDERGRGSIDLLVAAAARGDTAGRPHLIMLFSPEHGIRGTEDRQHIASGRDERTGLPVHSLYGATTIAPHDSLLRQLDVLIIDLQDIGARTWTYVGAMVYAMRAAAANNVQVLVLDRPNPIKGENVEGPILQASLANDRVSEPNRPAKPFALYPIPLRHGMTMAELALFYNSTLRLGADLQVIPMKNWRRGLWFEETRMPWVRPSPNMPSVVSALLYPGLVAFEGSNLSVGRGTPEAFQQLGAPWLDAKRVVELLEDRTAVGVRFEAVRFTPRDPTDSKYGGQSIPGVRVVVTNRNRVQSARVGALLLWAISRANSDSLRINERVFDDRFGNPAIREALMKGEDPHSLMDREIPGTMEFVQRSRAFWLY